MSEISFEKFTGLYNYWIVVFLMMTGFYIVIARGNLIKTVLGLNIFQTSVFLLYITMGKIEGATAPIIPPEIAAAAAHGHGHGEHDETASYAADHVAEHAHEVAEIVYSNPLPSVLMLTAIVVGIATTATALALIVRVREDYGTIEEDEILEMDRLSDGTGAL